MKEVKGTPEQRTSGEQLVVEELASRIEQLLRAEGGAVKESRIVSRFRGFPEPRNEALKQLAEAGKIRKVRGSKTGTTLVALAEPAATRRGLKTTARAEQTRLAALEAERREALKPTAEEYNGGDSSFPTYRSYLEMLAAGMMKAEELPFKVPTEREEFPKVRRPRKWKGAASQTANVSAKKADRIPTAMRRKAAEQLGNGEAAWNTAKAQYVANLPTLAHKILHLLRRDEVMTEDSLLPLAKAEDQPVPEALLGRTLQELGEAGRIRKLRERSTGRIVFDAFGKMPKRELETLLIGVMADPKNGIPVPEDTRLARRVAAFRKAKATAKVSAQAKGAAEQEDEAAETEPQPVPA